MPSKSAKQAKFMRAIAAGWKPSRMKNPPSRAVAREFVKADKKAGRYYEGGLAPMGKVEEGKGGLGGLGGTAQSFWYGGPVKRALRQMEEQRAAQGDPNYQPWMAYGTTPLTWDQIPGGSMIKKALTSQRMVELGWVPSETGGNLKNVIWYPPESTIAGDQTGTPIQQPAEGYDPYYGYGPGSGNTYRGNRIGRGGGRGGRGGRRRTPPAPPPRDIPGATPPGRPPGGGLVPPTEPPPDYTPPDPRAGRDTEYSRRLREHQRRVAASLGVPGYAEGGEVAGYAEGGTARKDNPYPPGSARWKVWERKHGRDPNAPEPEPEAPPVAEAEPEEDEGLFGRWFGRTERELEEMENNFRGGRVGYQLGGYARAPYGGVPPRIAGMMKPRMGGIPPRLDPTQMATTQPVAPQGGLQSAISVGRPAATMMPPPVKSRPLTVPPTMGGGPTDMPPDLGGGPQIPPNLRGYLQRARMMSRPRRGIPGPAGAGGAPNRVGQRDQQGALARALQRGTGRPPMSRRQGFYR